MAKAIDKLKNICPYAATHTEASQILLHSGLKNASKPSRAPGNVTARMTIKIKTTNKVGMKIRLANSIPFFTPRPSIKKTSAQTISNGIKTFGTIDPNTPGSDKFKKSPVKNAVVSSPHFVPIEKYAYINDQATIIG